MKERKTNMSLDLTVDIRRKGEKEGITLLHYTTTPIRALLDLIHLEVYSDDYVILERAKINEIMKVYREEVESNKREIDRINENQRKLEVVKANTQSIDIYDRVEQDIASNEDYLKYLKEEIEGGEYRYNEWYFVLSVLDNQYDYINNKNDYELVYHIA